MSRLPGVETELDPSVVGERLEAEARRGRFAGWNAEQGPGGQIGTLSDFGTPFESRMVVRAERAADGGGTLLRFERRIQPRVPLIVLVALIATVWPGVVLTDSILRTYWASYDYRTWMWYLPLTAPFVPLAMWSAWKKSDASGAHAARELIQRTAEILGGRLRAD